MREERTIDELTEGVVVEMRRMKYAAESIKIFNNEGKKLKRYAIEHYDTEIFSEEIGAQYLSDKLGFPGNTTDPLPRISQLAINCVRRLGQYAATNSFLNRRSPKEKTPFDDWSVGDNAVIMAYVEFVQTADNHASTKERRIHHIKRFYDFLGSRSILGMKSLSTQTISDYLVSMSGLSPVEISHHLTTLRNYFRYLYRQGYCSQDWSSFVPTIRRPKALRLPTLWEEEELKRMLLSVDRGNPVGKRNYAILLMVIQLGLRISDVAGLRLDSLKWERNEIELIQQKTGKKLIHPLLEDLGWAIIDYLRFARPKVDDPFVFVTLNAPYNPMAPRTVGDVLRKHMQLCGIDKPAGTVSGMHSLRHALARRLLAQDTPLQEVADILGHSSFSSSAPYLKVDIEGLRDCGLTIENACLHG